MTCPAGASSTRPSTWASPWIAVTALFHASVIFGLSKARSAMILLARSASRRCTSVTDRANFFRNVSSSTAESPPPTTDRPSTAATACASSAAELSA